MRPVATWHHGGLPRVNLRRAHLSPPRRRAAQRRPRFGHRPRHRPGRGLAALRAELPLRPAACGRARCRRGRSPSGRCGGSTPWWRSTSAPSGDPPSPADIPVPKDARRTRCRSGIPVTYVPARNTVFLSYALAWAEVLEATRHLHRSERAGLQRLSRLPPGVHRRLRVDGQPGHPRRQSREPAGGSRIHAPLIALAKREIIARGVALAWTMA